MISMRTPEIIVIPTTPAAAQRHVDLVKGWLALANSSHRDREISAAEAAHRREVDRRAAEIKRLQDSESVIRGINI